MTFETKGGSIQEALKAFLTDPCTGPIADISPTSDLLKEGIIDSLNLLRVLDFLEQRYQIRIGNEDVVVENFCSLAAIEALVERAVKRRSQTAGREAKKHSA